MPDDDSWVDEYFGDPNLPTRQEDQPCGFCRRVITDADIGTAVWVADGDGPWRPFCNAFHRDAFYKQGLWKVDDTQPEVMENQTSMPALSLDEE